MDPIPLTNQSVKYTANSNQLSSLQKDTPENIATSKAEYINSQQAYPTSGM
jgi:hypothetical protein